jgi:hypothetical protein
VGGEFLTHGAPRRVEAGVAKGFLDSHEQMIAS